MTGLPDAPLWLVRHAPTRDNLDAVIMGQRDPEAIAEGLDGADRLLEGVVFARVVSSDARRAQATARALAAGRPLCLDERLRERSFGHWEGRRKTELRAAHPQVLTATGAVRLDAEIPGLEPVRAMFARVHAVLAELREIDGRVLVVGHNGSLRAAMVLLGVSELEFAATNSLAHLLPVAADLARLRDPASVLAEHRSAGRP